MEGYLETFKNYVPAEILAAFITINSLVPYDASYDLKIIIPSMFVLTVIFIFAAVKLKRIKSKFTLFVVSLMLPFWCMMVAMERFEEQVFSTDTKVAISVALVIVSLTLTMFAPTPRKADHAGT